MPPNKPNKQQHNTMCASTTSEQPEQYVLFGNYIVSTEDINDSLQTKRLGQLSTHFQDPKTKEWYATTTRPIFDKNSESEPLRNKPNVKRQPDEELIGKKAYRARYLDAQRNHLVTEPLILGTVMHVMGELVLLKCTPEWTNSERFKKDLRKANVAQNVIMKKTKSQAKGMVIIRSTESFDYLNQDGVTMEMARAKYPLDISIGIVSDK